MDATKLIAWLPFNESVTQDFCGNTWTAYGTPTIEDAKLKLPGSSSYLAMTGGITLGGQNFTIAGKFYLSSGYYCRIFSFYNAASTTVDCINLARKASSAGLYSDCMGTSSSTFDVTLNALHDFEYVYSHDEGKVRIFIDGVCKLTINKTIARTNFPNVFIGKSNYPSDGYFVGTIDEFQIYDGIALHTENFTPPTDEYYADLKNALEDSATFVYIVDVETKYRTSPKNDTDNAYIALTDGNYATLPEGILPDATEFTIEAKFSTTSTQKIQPISISRQ